MTTPPHLIQLGYLGHTESRRETLYALDDTGQIWQKALVPTASPWTQVDGPPGTVRQMIVSPDIDSTSHTLYVLTTDGHIWAHDYHWNGAHEWTQIEGPHDLIPTPAVSVLSPSQDPSPTSPDDADTSWPCRGCKIVQPGPATTYWHEDGFCSVTCAMHDFLAHSASLPLMDNCTRHFLTTGIEELLHIAALANTHTT